MYLIRYYPTKLGISPSKDGKQEAIEPDKGSMARQFYNNINKVSSGWTEERTL